VATVEQTDEDIKKEVVDHLYWNNEVDASDISVSVDDGEVTLRGTVPSINNSLSAEDSALDIEGVYLVDNQLEIEVPEPPETVTDNEIETRVNDSLLWDSEVDSTEVDVEVDNGSVTIKGAVDEGWKRIRVENKVSDLEGVVSVRNELSVVPTEDVMDEAIAVEITRSLERNVYVNPDDVTVNVENGEVTVTGTVYSYRAKSEIYDAAIRTGGVKTVNNDVMVETKSASRI